MLKKYSLTLLAALAAVLIAASAQAALLGTVFHDYGKDGVDPGGNDKLSKEYVTVSEGSSSRFHDSFDLSGIAYADVDHFTLTLTYADTNSGCIWPFREDWRVRPGDSSTLLDIDRVGGTPATQSFTIGGDVDTFASMVGAKAFILWFAEESSHCGKFKLYSAALNVYGSSSSAAPIPGAAWLLGTGLAGLLALRRRSA